MVQRRAVKFTTNKYCNTSSDSALLNHLQWESLESRRTKAQLTMLYKIANNLVDIPADKYLTLAYSQTRANHRKKFQLKSASTNCFKFSFFPCTIGTWNKLPSIIAEAPDLVSHKQELSKITF